MLRELSADEVEFTIDIDVETQKIEGNCSAIDEETDKETYDWIINELNHCNRWAWCIVIVTASWQGFIGMDCLGCCSYKNEQAFKDSDYYEDMKTKALANLNQSLQNNDEKLKQLRW